MSRLTVLLISALLLSIVSFAYAAAIFNGYEQTEWGTQFHQIMETYPKGQFQDYQKEFIYTQEKPDPSIGARIFGFKDGRLTSVSVTFSPEYVKKVGADKIKESLASRYGKGKASGGGKGSHAASYVWENKRTRITFMTVPQRFDMTVVQYEKK